MKRERFHQGDLIEVVTVDRARSGTTTNRRPKPVRKERWRAVVVGPSVLGQGWWMVKKVNGHDAPWMTYTVLSVAIGPA